MSRSNNYGFGQTSASSILASLRVEKETREIAIKESEPKIVDREKLLMVLYKHEGVGKLAAKDLGMGMDKFRKAMSQHDFSLAEFKEELNKKPEFADLMRQYANDPPSTPGEVASAHQEAQRSLERPTDGRTVADVEAIEHCPHCDEPARITARSFKYKIFLNRIFLCNTEIDRRGYVIRSKKCMRIEKRNGVRVEESTVDKSEEAVPAT